MQYSPLVHNNTCQQSIRLPQMLSRLSSKTAGIKQLGLALAQLGLDYQTAGISLSSKTAGIKDVKTHSK